ncbi:MAG TPA: tRNA (guanosine(46)-N7)-methyltransferase TrmB [Candidatus Contendobacter sp.]|nr:tRNA (guanosine(46)-N7)-methyltransferase TrmB [Candidatus Contendobacter sp.]
MLDESRIGADAPLRIRSFVLRGSRMTRAQHRALTDLWERFGIESGNAPLPIVELFGRQAPLMVEIGFGDGESLVAMASADPEVNYLGIEVHHPGIGHLLLRAEELGLTHLRVMRADAVEVLERQLPDESIDRIQIFFPDPWPKARHHKRRLIQGSFIELLARKLKSAGQLHIATDCEDYARSILDLLNVAPGWVNMASDHGFTPRPAYRPPTKFEQRGRRLGHEVWDLLFMRRK